MRLDEMCTELSQSPEPQLYTVTVGNKTTLSMLNAVHNFYTLITMTSLQLIQAQGLGYTRGMYRVILSIQTYDSVIKVHGMVLASSSGHFPPPTWPKSEVNMICIASVL